jgi:hypothetical protein
VKVRDCKAGPDFGLPQVYLKGNQIKTIKKYIDFDTYQ